MTSIFLACLLQIARDPTPARAVEAARRAVASGRATLLGETSEMRLDSARSAPPGAPPVLSFRYMEGERRGRFGDLDLVVDDAGH